MKVKPSVKPICDKCRSAVTVVMVICETRATSSARANPSS